MEIGLFTTADWLRWTAPWIGILTLIQGCEFLALRKATEDDGIWRWHEIESFLFVRKSLPRRFLRLFLHPHSFWLLNWVRLGVGIWVFISPLAFLFWILLFIHILTQLRWLGTFNGGSDSMTLLLLLTASFVASQPSGGLIAQGAIYYLAIQLTLSYWKAGWFKIKNPLWRSGQALQSFIQSPHYEMKPKCLSNFLQSASLFWAGSWIVMAFELLFPFFLLSEETLWGGLALGVLFHATNAYLFGLNRFFFAWVAAYPSLIFLRQALI